MPRDWDSQQPAIEFEQLHGVSGVAGHYKFPDERKFGRSAMQQRIWDYYDAASNPGPELIRKFGDVTGRPGVTRQDIQADKKLGSAFGEYLRRGRHEELTDMSRKLGDLNPEQIAKLHFDHMHTTQLSDVVHGMVSGFNPDDINHYVARFHGTACLAEVERTAEEVARRSLERKILDKLGKAGRQTIGWIASHSTLERIWEQVKGRPLQALEKGIQEAALHLRR